MKATKRAVDGTAGIWNHTNKSRYFRNQKVSPKTAGFVYFREVFLSNLKQENTPRLGDAPHTFLEPVLEL